MIPPSRAAAAAGGGGGRSKRRTTPVLATLALLVVALFALFALLQIAAVSHCLGQEGGGGGSGTDVDGPRRGGGPAPPRLPGGSFRGAAVGGGAGGREREEGPPRFAAPWSSDRDGGGSEDARSSWISDAERFESDRPPRPSSASDGDRGRSSRGRPGDGDRSGEGGGDAVPAVHAFDQKLLDDAAALRAALALRGDAIGGGDGGGGNARWEAVDWDAPIPPQDEALFRCEWSIFVSSTGEKAFLCDDGAAVARRTGGDGNAAGEAGNVVECPSSRYFTDVWYRGYAGNGPIYVDVGADRGACILEMLLETSASILAFEQHPKKVHGIKKTLAELDDAFRRRVTLFPIGLADVRSNRTIKHMGIRFPVHAERLDAVVNVDALPPERNLMIDVETRGLGCQILDGMGARMANRTEVARLNWDAFGHCQGGTDSVDILRGFGFDVYRGYDYGQHGWAGVYRAAVPVGKKPKFDGIDLYATRKFSYRGESKNW